MTDFSADLLDWYDRHRRDLPWRYAPGVAADPYRVWLSEIMLQQTTVQAVKPYFAKFTRMWPKVTALADSPLEDVLTAWAGLGYYARARNLHRCAQAVRDNHDGRFPETEAALRALPGIGDYTAAAIAAIAFGARATVVDGNIERITARLFKIDTPLPKAKKAIKAALAPLVPADRPGDFAQAMMDLGAGICRPKDPDCLICPIRPACGAQKAGTMLHYPVKPAKKPKPVRRAVAFWVASGGRILLERRPDTGLLGGMQGLFSTPWVGRSDFPTKSEALDFAPVKADWHVGNAVITHVFTHFQLDVQIWRATDVLKDTSPPTAEWVDAKTFDASGLPTVFKKMLPKGDDCRAY